MDYVCSYSDVLSFYVSVAAELDNRPEMAEIPIGRMTKQAEKAKKPTAPRIPNFLALRERDLEMLMGALGLLLSRLGVLRAGFRPGVPCLGPGLV